MVNDGVECMEHQKYILLRPKYILLPFEYILLRQKYILLPTNSDILLRQKYKNIFYLRDMGRRKTRGRE